MAYTLTMGVTLLFMTLDVIVLTIMIFRQYAKIKNS